MRTPPWLLALTLCAAIFTGGCATPALWGVKSCTPANDPHLTLAFAPEKHDILVQYDEQHGSPKHTHAKSFWLFAYSDNPPTDRAPRFIEATNLPTLISIPIVDWNTPLPANGYSARALTPAMFDLYHEGVDMGRFQLPGYSTHYGPATTTRILLTPPAVLADTLIVSSIVAIYVSPYILEAYANH